MSDQKQLSWGEVFGAVLAALILSIFFERFLPRDTRPAHIGKDNHRVMRVVHSPKSKSEDTSLGKVIFVTGLEGDPIASGNLYACTVPDQAYDWAEYMDTIQLTLNNCWRIAP